MLGFAPSGTRPICSLRGNTLPAVTITAEASIEAILESHVATLFANAGKRLVLAARIACVPLDD